MNALPLVALSIFCFAPPEPSSGTLVIVGGGGTPKSATTAFLETCGGEKAAIAVLPQASKREDRGQGAAAMWLKAGAKQAFIVEFDDKQKASEQLERATGVWFPGGSQTDLYAALKEAGLLEWLRKKHREGLPFGGTSAGAAIMSLRMIPRPPEKPGLRAGNTPVIAGLGLTPELIVDQHFIERSRMNRLLGAVMDHPTRIGVGLGESTAIVIRDGRFKVVGDGSVVVIDARQASAKPAKPGALQSVRDLRMHVLRAGDQYDGRSAGN